MNKQKINIRIEPELLERIEARVAADITLRDRTQFMEIAAHEKLERDSTPEPEAAPDDNHSRVDTPHIP